MARTRRLICEYTLNMPRPIRTLLAVFTAPFLGTLVGCSKAPTPTEPVVLVEVAPLVSLVQPLVGEGVVVRPIVPAGRSPHGYQLTPGDAQAMASAALVISVGPVLEPSITRAVERQVPPARSVSIAGLLGIDTGDAHDHHDHGDHEGHDHHGVDPHLWLDPRLMADFVDAIRPELTSRALAAEDITARAARLKTRVETVDIAYRDALARHAGRAIITHHDAFRRVADRFGLTIAQVVRPVSTVEPTPGDLARVEEAVRQYGVGAIFIEPQYPDALPRRIAERLGLEVLTLDPEGGEDWFVLMQTNLDALLSGLSTGVPSAVPDAGSPATPVAPNADETGG
jgi:ABC-type Zn uptake system ZnuABC Zn-binding protein ZnuA